MVMPIKFLEPSWSHLSWWFTIATLINFTICHIQFYWWSLLYQTCIVAIWFIVWRTSIPIYGWETALISCIHLINSRWNFIKPRLSGCIKHTNIISVFRAIKEIYIAEVARWSIWARTRGTEPCSPLRSFFGSGKFGILNSMKVCTCLVRFAHISDRFICAGSWYTAKMLLIWEESAPSTEILGFWVAISGHTIFTLVFELKIILICTRSWNSFPD